MAERDLSKADFGGLLNLAEADFSRWLRKTALPDRDRELRALKSQERMLAGRALGAEKIWEDFLVRSARERIGFYAKVAHRSGNREMLSPQRLEEYRKRIMISVESACKALRETIEQEARAAADVSPTQVQALLNVTAQLPARILDVVNDELGVLEAEGRVSPYHRKVDAGVKGSESRSDPEIIKRSAVIRQAPQLSAKDLCKQFDLHRINFPGDWQAKFAIKTWAEAYMRPVLRGRIDTMISKTRKGGR